MDALAPTSYREPARLEPRVFVLGPAGISIRAYATTVISLVLTVVLYVISDGGGPVIFVAPLVGVTLPCLVRFGPRAIEVHNDSVVVRSHYCRPRRIAASDLVVHLLPDALVLLGPTTSIKIRSERFPGRSLVTCAHALRKIASR